MTARDEVAGLPGGAGESLAAKAKPVYTADPGSVSGLADDLAKAAGDAEGATHRVSAAVADLHTWKGDTADAFRGYMGRFAQAGTAGHGALTAGATALRNAAKALAEGRSSLEKAFEQILTDYRNNLKSYGTTPPHPTPAEQADAAQAAVSANSAAITSQVESIDSALGTAAGALHGAASGLSPRFTSLPAPGVATPAPTHTSAASGPAGGSGAGGGSGGGGGGGAGGLGPSGGPPASPPPGNVQQWIQQAIQVLEQHGVPAGALSAQDIWTIIQHESGGNPNAINLWDSNAQAGHPSKGLMQTIDSTFRSYALPGHGDIYNPVDNIIAGVRYALSRYGSIENVPGIVAVHSGRAYVGY